MSKLTDRAVFILVAAIAFAARVPFAVSHFRLYPDAIAYLNIARNLAKGEGFTSTLKLNYFCPSDVAHCALEDWPPLYPAAAGAVLWLARSELALQVCNALLIGVCAGLVFLIGSRLFDRASGFAAGMFACIAPSLFRAGTTAMSDALGLALALAAIVAALSAAGSGVRWAGAGALAGAAYLARYPNAIAMLALAAYAYVGVARRRMALWLAAGFVAAAGPVLAWKWAVYGSPLHATQLMHYNTLSYGAAAWSLPPGGWQADHIWFVEALPQIGAAILSNTAAYLASVVGGAGGLYLLSLGAVGLVVTQGRSVLQNGRGLALSIAALNFAAHAATWSLPPTQAPRFLLLTVSLLLPFCAAGLVGALRSGNRFVGAAAVAVCIAVTIRWGQANMAAAAGRMWQYTPRQVAVARGLCADLPAGTTVATNSPWLISYSTGLPTATLPHRLDRAKLARFVRRYGVDALVLMPGGARGSRYGQKAYDGSLNTIPQIVQKLPTMHSPRMMPRKKGSARLYSLRPP